jgi:hypothetical protein
LEPLGLYRSAVDPFWDSLEGDLDSLPPHLYLKSRLLRQTLAVRYSSTGTFRDILRSPGADPVFHQHLWLLDDLGIPDGTERSRVEEHVFRAMVQTFCVLQIDEADREPDAHPLADCLARRSASEFSQLLPKDITFWPRYHQRWEAHQEAILSGEFAYRGSNESEAMSLHAALVAPLALGPLAVACWAGRFDDLEQLEAMLDHLSTVQATFGALTAIKRDLGRGRVSPTIRLMMGFAAAPGDNPERILGEILLSGAIDPVIERCHTQLEGARTMARSLQLPTFASYAKHLDGVADEIRSLLSLNGKREPSRLRLQPAPLTIAQSIMMAQGYLLADRTFQEAWEVHRWGMNGVTELSARFPAGLIIEILGRHGVEVGELVDDFFRHAEDKHFSYYDHPATPYIDTDNLGVLLRIVQYSDDSPSRHRTLQDLLALLATNVGPDGRLPVWLNPHDEAEPVMFLGEGCGTIEANLLLALLRYQPHESGHLVLRASRRLLADFASRGTSITVNYPRTYTLAVVAELLSDLTTQGLSDQIPDLAAADDRLRFEIERETSRSRIGPQNSACLIWARYSAGLAHLPSDGFLGTIVNSQSFDGGWPAEPFFFAPSAGGRAMWFSSRLLTSAVCYHALNLVGPAANGIVG